MTSKVQLNNALSHLEYNIHIVLSRWFAHYDIERVDKWIRTTIIVKEGYHENNTKR